MAFRLIAAAVALSFAAHPAFADEPADQACKQGFPWRVPPKNEQYLVMGNAASSYRICHCSAKAPDGFFLELNVSRSGRTEFTRLHKSSCIFTNAELVWIRNADAAVAADGTIE